MSTSLLRDLKQTRPFASPGEEAAVALMRTADVLRRLVGNVTAWSDITLQQYNVLRILRGAGEKGLPTLEIAERMIEETPGITRLVDRLEKKRLVHRERSAADRRQVFCRITAAALELLQKLDEPMRHAAESALKTLSKKDLAQLVALLDRTREGVQSLIEQEVRP